jgi:hypothetical protein
MEQQLTPGVLYYKNNKPFGYYIKNVSNMYLFSPVQSDPIFNQITGYDVGDVILNYGTYLQEPNLTRLKIIGVQNLNGITPYPTGGRKRRTKRSSTNKKSKRGYTKKRRHITRRK